MDTGLIKEVNFLGRVYAFIERGEVIKSQAIVLEFPGVEPSEQDTMCAFCSLQAVVHMKSNKGFWAPMCEHHVFEHAEELRISGSHGRVLLNARTERAIKIRGMKLLKDRAGKLLYRIADEVRALSDSYGLDRHEKSWHIQETYRNDVEVVLEQHDFRFDSHEVSLVMEAVVEYMEQKTFTVIWSFDDKMDVALVRAHTKVDACRYIMDQHDADFTKLAELIAIENVHAMHPGWAYNDPACTGADLLATEGDQVVFDGDTFIVSQPIVTSEDEKIWVSNGDDVRWKIEVTNEVTFLPRRRKS